MGKSLVSSLFDSRCMYVSIHEMNEQLEWLQKDKGEALQNTQE